MYLGSVADPIATAATSATQSIWGNLGDMFKNTVNNLVAAFPTIAVSTISTLVQNKMASAVGSEPAKQAAQQAAAPAPTAAAPATPAQAAASGFTPAQIAAMQTAGLVTKPTNWPLILGIGGAALVGVYFIAKKN